MDRAIIPTGRTDAIDVLADDTVARDAPSSLPAGGDVPEASNKSLDDASDMHVGDSEQIQDDAEVQDGTLVDDRTVAECPAREVDTTAVEKAQDSSNESDEDTPDVAADELNDNISMPAGDPTSRVALVAPAVMVEVSAVET